MSSSRKENQILTSATELFSTVKVTFKTEVTELLLSYYLFDNKNEPNVSSSLPSKVENLKVKNYSNTDELPKDRMALSEKKFPHQKNPSPAGSSSRSSSQFQQLHLSEVHATVHKKVKVVR